MASPTARAAAGLLNDRQRRAADRRRFGGAWSRLEHRQLLGSGGDDAARRLANRLRGGRVGLGGGPRGGVVGGLPPRVRGRGPSPPRAGAALGGQPAAPPPPGRGALPP